jgi:hypothetical protein
MPLREDDYWLEWHKEYPHRLKLLWTPYKQPSPGWDHDHCEFCWQRFAEQTSHYTDAEFIGYVASDGTRQWWVCNECANDLKGHYLWEFIGGPSLLKS